MRVSVSRKSHFNAAHRLHNPAWTAERNKAVFGLCNNPNYHGHNYDLIVSLEGEVDPETGYVFDLKVLSDLVENEVIEPFDHRNFNLDVAEFADLNPTAENIAGVIWRKLRAHLPMHLDLKVRLYETPRNFVDYAGN